MSDPAVWIRFAAMFALALMTTAVWTQFLPLFSSEPDSGKLYRRWCNGLSAGLAIISFVVLSGVEGIIKQPSAAEHIRIMYPYFGIVLLFVFISAILFIASIWKPVWGYGAAAAHILTLVSFAVTRQIGQNNGVSQYVDVSKMPLDVQWSPLIAFLVIFVLGLVVIAWMVKQVIVNKQVSG
ncbi:hypothetical protein FACS1894214_5330 [Planctomycetales bacterium]|nr:hypothetical protein FACS1894214_5330 [Planctomycetales bacterium]